MRLVVRLYQERNEPSDPIPLASAAREVRIAAIAEFGNLAWAIVARMEKMLGDLTDNVRK
jgi:hypothetical protein